MPALVAGLATVTATLSLWLLPQGSAPNWLGIAAFASLAIGAEVANIELYAKHTSVSTSVAALLAGILLFGAPAALCIGVGIAAAAWLKYRSPAIRLLFNASNHVLGGMLCVLILTAAGPLTAWPLLMQVALTVACVLVLYLSSTLLVALAIGITSGKAPLSIWSERFQWLGLHYVGLSFVAFGMYSTYPDVGPIGILIVLLPLAIIRYGQKQYVEATEGMLTKLQRANEELEQQKQELKHRNGEMLKLLAAALDLRDPSVQSHSEQVAMYATAIARHLHLPAARVELIRQAALLHDIGKLAVPDRVLFKSTRLSPEEYAAVKEHPVVGAGLLQQFTSLDAVAGFVLHHHEHFDGTGYPDRLAGEQIPLEARIVGLADAVEAMASARPYQPALAVADVKAEIQRCSGTQFDPQIVAAFFAVLARGGDDVLIDTARPLRTWDTASTRIAPTCMPAATN
jgi:putative nucleotidyltransferase with HDIG domain